MILAVLPNKTHTVFIDHLLYDSQRSKATAQPQPFDHRESHCHIAKQPDHKQTLKRKHANGEMSISVHNPVKNDLYDWPNLRGSSHHSVALGISFVKMLGAFFAKSTGFLPPQSSTAEGRPNLAAVSNMLFWSFSRLLEYNTWKMESCPAHVWLVATWLDLGKGTTCQSVFSDSMGKVSHNG